MNPMFWILVIVGLVLLWMLLNFIFRPLGKYISKLTTEVKDNLNYDEQEEKEIKK